MLGGVIRFLLGVWVALRKADTHFFAVGLPVLVVIASFEIGSSGFCSAAHRVGDFAGSLGLLIHPREIGTFMGQKNRHAPPGPSKPRLAAQIGQRETVPPLRKHIRRSWPIPWRRTRNHRYFGAFSVPQCSSSHSSTIRFGDAQH